MSTISHSLRDHKEPTRQQLFAHTFALPSGQVPVTDIPAVLSLSNPNEDDDFQEDEVYAGRLTLTERFLCFESLDRRSCRQVLPLYCVRRVERLNTKRSGVFALAIVVWHGMRIILQLNALRTQCESFCGLLRDNLRAQLASMKTLKPFVASCFSEYVLNPELDPAYKGKESTAGADDTDETKAGTANDADQSSSAAAMKEDAAGEAADKKEGSSQGGTKSESSDAAVSYTPPPYHAGLGHRFKYPGDARKLREKSKMKLWRDYLRIHGRSLTCTRYPQFIRLIQVGLPSALRGEIWEVTSGSIYNRFENQGEYERLLKQHEGSKTTATEDIEKDLHRSLPEYAGFQTPEGINRLRRVLYAFSFKNPELGYTQGLNILAAAFLIYCSEEQAFFLLQTVTDRLLPGYYTQSMAGTILDRRVFEHLVHRSLPMIHDHLVKTDMQLSVATLPWFLSLYINSMPMIFAFRIIDCFMAMGPKVLFQVALAILKINGEELLSVTDDGAFISVLRKYFASLGDSAHPNASNPKHRNITNFQELLVVAFREFGIITDETIASERRRFRQEIVDEIELFAKRSAVRQLRDLCRFNKDQAGLIYDHMVEAIYRSRHERQAREAALAVAGTADSSALSEKDQLAAASMITPPPPTSQDFKEMRIDYDTFKLFLGEMTTWARDEYTISNLSGLHERTEKKPVEHDLIKRLFHSWDTEKRGTLSFQDVISGMDPVVFSHGDVLSSIHWFFRLHSEGRDSLTKDEVLRLSESLLFMFRNEPGEGYLAAVSQLISQAFNVGGEVSPHGKMLEKEEKLMP